MEALTKVWEALGGNQKIYWFFAIVGTAVFCVQMVLAVFGFGMHHDMDTDADGDVEFGEHADTGLGDFKFFSLRSIFAFITFFGWGGALWGNGGLTSMFAGCASGTVMMMITATLLFMLMKMQHSGNITKEEMVGCKGRVYLTIPGGKVESGKVTVTVRDCTREIQAVAEEELKTGTSIEVVSVVDGSRYLVKKL